MYGAGLRRQKTLRLRIKDIDFGRKKIIVRQGKGYEDRITMLLKKRVPLFHFYMEECQHFYEAAIQQT
jgi:integrase